MVLYITQSFTDGVDYIKLFKNDPQKNFITIIDIARAGKATEMMVNYIREKQIVKNALS